MISFKDKNLFFILLILIIILFNIFFVKFFRENYETMEKYVDIHKTDKLYRHKYFRFYPQFLDNLNSSKYDNTGMLEIGLLEGHSLNLWLDYFPNKYIYGIDINDTKNDNSRVTIFKGDQSNINDLERIKNNINHKIFFIIDDGSHVPEHQITSFNYFFKELLEFDGVYIIEDIETSYWKNSDIYGYDINYGYQNEKSIIECFKLLLDFVNRQFLNETNINILKNKLINAGLSIDTCLMINNISFGENNIIIKKVRSPNEMQGLNIDYIFKNKL
jgi:hypothetical protein